MGKLAFKNPIERSLLVLFLDLSFGKQGSKAEQEEKGTQTRIP